MADGWWSAGPEGPLGNDLCVESAADRVAHERRRVGQVFKDAQNAAADAVVQPEPVERGGCESALSIYQTVGTRRRGRRSSGAAGTGAAAAVRAVADAAEVGKSPSRLSQPGFHALRVYAHHSKSSPSWTISRVSIATSLALAFKAGPSHLEGQPSEILKLISGCLASSSITIEMLRRSITPLIIDCRHFQSDLSCVSPRFRTMGP